MTKRDKDRYQETRRLQNAGVGVDTSDVVRFNSGSESYPHFITKSTVAYLGQLNGYFVECEATTNRGEIDCLLYHPERRNIAVEVETGWTEDVKEDKLSRYVHQQEGIDDMWMFEVLEKPQTDMETIKWICEKTGLKP